MTGNGVTQVAIYVVVLTALAYPFGIYMARVYTGGLRLPRWLTAPERGFYRLVGTKEDVEQTWKGYAKTSLIFMGVFAVLLYLLLRLQNHLPLNPRRAVGRAPAHLDQHDGELHHQHELAVLRRRDDDVVPEPDGGAGRAELRLGRARDGRARSRDPRASRAGRRRRSGTSGSISTARSRTSCCRSPSSSPWSSSPRASSRRSTERPRPARSRAASRRSRAARPRRRSRSSSSARTAAASTTRTRPCRSRTRRRSRTSSSCSRSC